MSSPQSDYCAIRLQQMKDLHAELFLLMDQSAQADPFAEHAGGLNRMIDSLMKVIDQEMKDFQRDVEEGRRAQALSEAFLAALAEFDSERAEALKLIYDRLRLRTQDLACERDWIKGRLQLIQRKRCGARGYRGHVEPSILLDSKI